MNTRIVLVSALLLGTAGGVGAVFAASESGLLPFGERHEARGDRPDGLRFRVADAHRKHDRNAETRGRHHDDDDDDDDHGGEGRGGEGRGAASPVGPTDPNAPVPTNGLFDGKTRPKVEVN